MYTILYSITDLTKKFIVCVSAKNSNKITESRKETYVGSTNIIGDVLFRVVRYPYRYFCEYIVW